MSALRVKPVYSMVELAAAMDISKRRVQRLLKTAEVPTDLLQGRRVIYACDLQAKLPRLWLSMVACDLRAEVQVRG